MLATFLIAFGKAGSASPRGLPSSRIITTWICKLSHITLCAVFLTSLHKSLTPRGSVVTVEVSSLRNHAGPFVLIIKYQVRTQDVLRLRDDVCTRRVPSDDGTVSMQTSKKDKCNTCAMRTTLEMQRDSSMWLRHQASVRDRDMHKKDGNCVRHTVTRINDCLKRS